MKNRLIAAAAAVVIGTTTLTACSTGAATTDKPGDAATTKTAVDANAFPVTIKNAFGSTTIEKEPTRVATLRSVDFYKLYRQRPDQYGIVMLNIARDLARRLRALDENFSRAPH